MDISFSKEKDRLVVNFIDDIMVFSKSYNDHLKHIAQVFQKWRFYGISLNSKKSNFVMQEGKLLGHIISKEGIKIDPERVTTIQKIDIPKTKKEIQSSLGQVNFLRRFIPSFAEIVKHIIKMLKKDSEIRWRVEARQSFMDFKQALIETPVLVSPNFYKYFLLFSFASKHIIKGVLLQKNDQNLEQPIDFFSEALRDYALKYNIIEK